MPAEWYFQSTSATRGPFSPSEMREFARLGHIVAETNVRKGDEGEWVLASQVKGLVTAPGSHPAPPPVTLSPPPIVQKQPERRVSNGALGANHDRAPFQRHKSLAIIIGASLLSALLPIIVAALSGRNGTSELTTEEVVSQSEASVAFVKGRLSSGTGFLVQPNTLVTNKHVIATELMESINIHFPSAAESRRGPFEATLVYEDETRDLEVLRVETGLLPLPIADDYRFRRGQEVIVIGGRGSTNGQKPRCPKTKNVCIEPNGQMSRAPFEKIPCRESLEGSSCRYNPRDFVAGGQA